jgi:hypothetical protein
MNSNLAPHSPHIQLAHQYWERILQPTDTAIDATCGNGKDTLKLAQILSLGYLIGLDIQAEAITRTQQRLKAHLSSDHLERVLLVQQSHISFPTCPHPVRLIVYNLGYLPGTNKQIKTQRKTTLISVKAALELIVVGGAVSITCYPGHPEGSEEQRDLLGMASHLPFQSWNICYHQWINSPLSPTLLIFQKMCADRSFHYNKPTVLDTFQTDSAL